MEKLPAFIGHKLEKNYPGASNVTMNFGLPIMSQEEIPAVEKQLAAKLTPHLRELNRLQKKVAPARSNNIFVSISTPEGDDRHMLQVVITAPHFESKVVPSRDQISELDTLAVKHVPKISAAVLNFLKGRN
ncbi:MAG: hypothetical protein ABIG96_06040 [Candidatus Micrarchaeota archaeon]